MTIKMNKLIFVALGFLLNLSFIGVVNAASFDCSKAGTPFEKTICANPTLSSLDEQMASAYSAAKSASSNPDQLKADQIAWIKGARSCGTDALCIENTYRNRMTELSPRQAAVSAPVAEQPMPHPNQNIETPVASNSYVANSQAPSNTSGGSGFLWVIAIAVIGGLVFFLKKKGSSSGSSGASVQEKKEGGASFLKAMVNTSEMNRWKEETFHTQAKQDAKNDKVIKDIALKANPGMSEAAYDAMKAAEVAAKQAKKQEELDMKAADIAHWEGIAAGTIPAGTPPPSQVAYEALPLEVRLQMEANKDAMLIARHNAEQARQHNARVDKTVNDLRNAEIFNTGQAEYLRQELEALKAKK